MTQPALPPETWYQLVPSLSLTGPFTTCNTVSGAMVAVTLPSLPAVLRTASPAPSVLATLAYGPAFNAGMVLLVLLLVVLAVLLLAVLLVVLVVLLVSRAPVLPGAR